MLDFASFTFPLKEQQDQKQKFRTKIIDLYSSKQT